MASLSQRLTELADRIRKDALAGDDTTKLANMLVEIDELLGYELSMLDQHGVALPANTQCGYVLCSVKKDGLFNKWSKVTGGYSPESGPFGDYLVFEDMTSAKDALAHMDAGIREFFRIFPVVLIAGIDQAKAEG